MDKYTTESTISRYKDHNWLSARNSVINFRVSTQTQYNFKLNFS